MTFADELQKLQQLRDAGTLDESEFLQAKERVLQEQSAAEAWNNRQAWVPSQPRDVDAEARQWAVLLHLSQFAGFLLPFAGLVLPFVLWQIKKDQLPQVDEHGKAVANWLLSALIYLVISAPLVIILVGIPMLLLIGLLMLIFPIIGAVRAGDGQVWKYPFSITFFR